MGLLVGAISGLGIHLWAKGLRQTPLLSAPWEHVAAIGIGSYVGYRYDFWIEELKEGLKEDLERHGRNTDVLNTKYD